MYKKYLTCLLFTSILILVAVAKTFSQEKEIPKELYTATGIPDSLKENANSVVRYDETNVTVKGPGKVTIKHHSIVTILNEKGDGEAIMKLDYNKKYDVFSDIDMR